MAPPTDDRQRFVIDQTATYVLRDGPDFEQVRVYALCMYTSMIELKAANVEITMAYQPLTAWHVLRDVPDFEQVCAWTRIPIVMYIVILTQHFTAPVVRKHGHVPRSPGECLTALPRRCHADPPPPPPPARAQLTSVPPAVVL